MLAFVGARNNSRTPLMFLCLGVALVESHWFATDMPWSAIAMLLAHIGDLRWYYSVPDWSFCENELPLESKTF